MSQEAENPSPEKDEGDSERAPESEFEPMEDAVEAAPDEATPINTPAEQHEHVDADTSAEKPGSFIRSGSLDKTNSQNSMGKHVGEERSPQQVGTFDSMSKDNGTSTPKKALSSQDELVKSGSQANVQKAAVQAGVKNSGGEVSDKTPPSGAGSKTNETSSQLRNETAEKVASGSESAKRTGSKDSEADKSSQGIGEHSASASTGATVRYLHCISSHNARCHISMPYVWSGIPVSRICILYLHVPCVLDRYVRIVRSV